MKFTHLIFLFENPPAFKRREFFGVIMSEFKLWRSPREEMRRGEIIAVHDRTYSIGYKSEFDLLSNFESSVIAWCYRNDLIESAKRAMQDFITEEEVRTTA